MIAGLLGVSFSGALNIRGHTISPPLEGGDGGDVELGGLILPAALSIAEIWSRLSWVKAFLLLTYSSAHSMKPSGEAFCAQLLILEAQNR